MPKASQFSKPHDLDRELRRFGELPQFTADDFRNLQDDNGCGGSAFSERREPPPETVAKVEAMKEMYTKMKNAAFVRPETPWSAPEVPSMIWCGARGED